MDLKRYIREVPDFPKQGISFKDITPLLSQPVAFQYVIDKFAEICSYRNVEVVAGVESRGFMFGAPLAATLQKPFVPIRKAGKLPYTTSRIEYSLEYDHSALEIHTDAISLGERVVIVDDLLATGGTLQASSKLVRQIGGKVVTHIVVVELVGLGGRSRLSCEDVESLVKY